MDFGKVAVEARKRGAQVLELLKETAFEVSWDVRDAAKTGFGVPRLASKAASLGVASLLAIRLFRHSPLPIPPPLSPETFGVDSFDFNTVAAAGAASVAFDFVGKVWGKKECATCNGWEGLRCQICSGRGKVRYNVNDSLLTETERSSSQSIAAAAVEGRAEIEYLAHTDKFDLPFPSIVCPECDGTGVMKCITCSGDAWVPKFTIAKTMGAPWLAWDAYRKIKSSDVPSNGVWADPAYAAFQMFGKDELQRGVQYDDEIKQAAMAKYEDAREYDTIREQVERRDPGWETLQKVMFIKDPERAANDPVIVTNVPYYKAKTKIMREVEDLPVPPPPEDWLISEKPLSESDWTKEDLKDPRKRTEMKVLLEGQENFFNKLRERTWENHWRSQKFEEIKKEVIDSYEHEKDTYQRPIEPELKQNTTPGVGTTSPSPSSTKTAKPVGKKSDAKKRPEDDKRRKERQERSERMARQAAVREAALSKAKAVR